LVFPDAIIMGSFGLNFWKRIGITAHDWNLSCSLVCQSIKKAPEGA